ncbi:MAG TPA: TetR family transcriptional regulator, partial [Burkholderiales bacterium]|nr:TetR family transcriptional regulator [Burkholderiales bacterium]
MRRTKEQAQQTRRNIMAAALRTFNRRGIAHTTMEDIAAAARVTRGAIYWHFAGKLALLRAIRDDVSLPLVDKADFTLLNDRESDPL